MYISRSLRTIGITGFAIVTAIVAIMFFIVSTGGAQGRAISADAAVYKALQYAREGVPAGSLQGDPTDIRGQLLSYEQAVNLSFKGSARVNDANIARPTWVIVFRGNIVANIPGSADGKIPPKQEIFPQMSLVVDGITGEFLAVSLRAPGDELAVDTLPRLKLVTQPPQDLPSPPNFPTTAPEPTIVAPSS